MEVKTDINEIFEEHSDMVYRLAFARVKNCYDADDILQEVFLRFLKVKEKTISKEHTKALLIRITINCSKSMLSSPFKTRFATLSEEIPYTDGTKDTLDAVLRLPLKYRTVIHLYYYCGYKVEEIAEILSTKPSTVKSQLKRAREKLKSELEGVEFDV